MWRLQIDTYEGDDPAPVVSHVFYGATKDDALAVAEAHKGTDTFFAGSLRGKWNGIPLHNETRWHYGR